MKRNAAIPGDILKVIRKVDNQEMKVNINGNIVKMKRALYDNIMKSTFLVGYHAETEGDSLPAGFYIVDGKARKATLVYDYEQIKSSDVQVKVNDMVFKIQSMIRGYSYE